MDEFIIRALLGGLGIAILCGPLGCLVVWQHMAYFGAALSHAALLGIALGLLLKIHLNSAVLAVCVALAFLLLIMNRHKDLTSDTILGILAHGSLALGIVIISLIPTVRMDLMAYLFGDLLSINWQDVLWIYAGGAAVLFILRTVWQPLLSLIIQRDLALVDGINEQKVRLIFLLLLGFVVAIAMQVVGILLVVSMLIIPAACARKYSDSPEKMAVLAIAMGGFSVAAGVIVSLIWNTPAGPSIVVAASVLFLLSVSTGSGQNQSKFSVRPR